MASIGNGVQCSIIPFTIKQLGYDGVPISHHTNLYDYLQISKLIDILFTDKVVDYLNNLVSFLFIFLNVELYLSRGQSENLLLIFPLTDVKGKAGRR